MRATAFGFRPLLLRGMLICVLKLLLPGLITFPVRDTVRRSACQLARYAGSAYLVTRSATALSPLSDREAPRDPAPLLRAHIAVRSRSHPDGIGESWFGVMGR